eukprot:g5303.t1
MVDYKGQEFAEKIYQVLVIVSSLIGFVWGFAKQDFKYTFYLCTPDWPMFNKNPIKWQSSVHDKLERARQKTAGAKNLKTKRGGGKPKKAK